MAVNLKGIDVSTWQGVINWPQVKAAGIQFAIVRAGHGMSRELSNGKGDDEDE